MNGDVGVVVTARSDKKVYYVPLTDNGANDAGVVSIPLAHGPQGPSTDGVRMYWAEPYGPTIIAKFLDGGDVEAISGDAVKVPDSTTVAGNLLYWVNGDDSKVYSTDPSTDAGTAKSVGGPLNANDRNGTSIVTDQGQTQIFWIVSSGSIYQAPADGNGATRQVGSAPPSLGSGPLAIANGYVYFIIGGGADKGGIYRVPLNGGPGAVGTRVVRQAITEPQPAAPGIAADGKYLYYADSAGNAIWRYSLGANVPDGGLVPDAGDGPEAIFQGQHTPGAVRVTDKYIYWVNSGDPGGANGGLMRAKK